MVKKLWQYVELFSSDTETSRMDRRTDGWTDRIAISVSCVSVLTRDTNDDFVYWIWYIVYYEHESDLLLHSQNPAWWPYCIMGCMDWLMCSWFYCVCHLKSVVVLLLLSSNGICRAQIWNVDLPLFFLIRVWYLRCCGCTWNRGRQHLATPLKTCQNIEAGFLTGWLLCLSFNSDVTASETPPFPHFGCVPAVVPAKGGSSA